MYVILAKLFLRAIRNPLDTSSSAHQYGSHKGCTPTKQAMHLLAHLLGTEDTYAWLLDIAKVFPSTPHDSIHTALDLIGTPQVLRAPVYKGSTNQYHQQYQHCLTCWIKEGFPLSPSLFILHAPVYKGSTNQYHQQYQYCLTRGIKRDAPSPHHCLYWSAKHSAPHFPNVKVFFVCR